jgi:hypothetical protein
MRPSSDLQWRKSSFSGVNGDCVEVAPLPIGIAIRDSKNIGGSTLAFPSATSSRRVAEIRQGPVS